MSSEWLAFLLSGSVQTQFGLRLLIASLELAILAFGLELVTHAFKLRRPRLAACLWALVLLKPLITLGLGSPVVLARVEIAPASLSFSQTTIPGPAAGIEVRGKSVTLEPSALSGEKVQTRNGRIPYPGRATWFSIPIGRRKLLTGLTWCWVIGIVLGGIRGTLAGYRLRRIIARGNPPDSRLVEIYDREAERIALSRRPKLATTAEIESPVLFGAVWPIILLPAWLSERDAGALRHLLGHELVHHRHRDAWFLALGHLSLLLFFFHPVAHFAFRRWLGFTELACDRALVQSDAEARAYAHELFSVLEGMQRRQAALAGLYATRHQIGVRVTALLEDPMGTPAGLDGFARSMIFAYGAFLLLFGLGVESWEPEAGGDDAVFVGSLRAGSGPESPEF